MLSCAGAVYLTCVYCLHEAASIFLVRYLSDPVGVEEGTLQPGMSVTTARHMSVLQHIPFVVPFKDRVKVSNELC